LFRNTIFSWCT